MAGREAAQGVALTTDRRNTPWKRAWKIELIESLNPQWRDLYPDII